MTPRQALDLLLAHLHDLRRAEVPLTEAIGLTLAEDLTTVIPNPPFDSALKDGYAIAGDATRTAAPTAPVPLRVREMIPAGTLFLRPLEEERADKIMTGAALPAGADAVVAVEHANVNGDVLSMTEAVAPGHNVQPRAEYWDSGETLLERGARVTPVTLSLAASAGVDSVHVRPRPTVGIIATGNELVAPGHPLEHGQIPASSPPMLAEQIKLAGGVPRYYGIVGDNAPHLTGVMRQAFSECDVVLSTGGSGKGDFDLMARVAADLGVELLFDSVAQRPGKSMIGGVLDNAVYLGLPGRPVAAMICFEIYVRPIIRRLLRQEPNESPVIHGKINQEVEKQVGVTQWVGVSQRADSVDVLRFDLRRTPGSGLRDLIDVHGLAELPPELDRVGTETQVTIYLLDEAFRTGVVREMEQIEPENEIEL
ncbi:MAG: molybdopterin molybdotransferase MoeA [Candidatus Lernaella stagnicola]|nr:molybdopterin molybdotransferase MoeA [Candidatus Lernaella stagnicola]